MFFVPCVAAPLTEQIPEEINQFWFGKLTSPTDYPEAKSKLWFTKSDQFDAEIKYNFEPLLLKAKAGELASWGTTAKGRLALILLTDQFSRNMYRGTAKSFGFDAIALQLSLEGIKQGQDRELLPIERVFFYLPLEHAEDLTIQQLSIEKFNQLVKEAPPSMQKTLQSYARYAKMHYDIVAKFGRFPHRNAILNRESTPEERQFLQGANSSF